MKLIFSLYHISSPQSIFCFLETVIFVLFIQYLLYFLLISSLNNLLIDISWSWRYLVRPPRIIITFVLLSSTFLFTFGILCINVSSIASKFFVLDLKRTYLLQTALIHFSGYLHCSRFYVNRQILVCFD